MSARRLHDLSVPAFLQAVRAIGVFRDRSAAHSRRRLSMPKRPRAGLISRTQERSLTEIKP